MEADGMKCIKKNLKANVFKLFLMLVCGEATMCCLPTNLAFFPLLSEANVAGSFYKHAD